MEILTTILQTPITQFLGLALVIGLLQKMGIDVVSILKAIFRVNGNGNGINLTAIDAKLDKIASNGLTHVTASLDKLTEAIKEHHAKEEAVFNRIEDIWDKLKD